MSAVPPIAPSATPPAPPAKPVPNYLAWSITMTVLCFLICCISCYSFPGIVTGIVAIVFASKVNGLLNAGDVEGALRASRSAKIWAWVTTGILILAVVVFLVSLAFIGVDGYMEKIQEIQQQVESAR